MKVRKLMSMKKAIQITAVVMAVILLALFAVQLGANYKNLSTKSSSSSTTEEQNGNSLNNYINQVSQSDAADTATKNTDNLNITDLTYDLDSGLISVETTQTMKCTVKVSFLTDDSKEKVIATVTSEVKQGNMRKTEIQFAKMEKLPEYFLIKAELVNEFDMTLSNEFYCNTYTKNMQEIFDADVNDFEPEQVVNFDEDEDNNFIVLSGSTKYAKSNDERNTLISADYQNGKYVFKNSDEVVNGLKKGDFFYIQPDNENIIAVKVENIQTNGDETTVIGNDDEIDEMFDFIKIDTEFNTENSTLELADSNETLQMASGSSTLKHDSSFNLEFAYNFTNDKFTINSVGLTESEKNSDNVEQVSAINALSFKFSLSFTGTLEFYKNKSFKYVKYTNENSGEITAKYSAGIDATDKTKISDILGSNKTDKQEEKSKTITIGSISAPSSVPGLSFKGDVAAEIKICGNFIVSSKITCKSGFTYDSDSDKWTEFKSTSPTIKNSMAATGEVFVGINITPKIVVFTEKLFSFGFPIQLGLKLSANLSILDWSYTLGTGLTSFNALSTDLLTAVQNNYGTLPDSIHNCDMCITGDAKVVFNISVSVTGLFIYNNKFSIWNAEIKLFDWYFSCDNLEFGFGQCPYKSYKTTFKFLNINNYADDTLRFTVDDSSVILNSSSLDTYLTNGAHSYSITATDEEGNTSTLISGRFTIYEASKTVTLNLSTGDSSEVDGEKEEYKEPTIPEELTEDSEPDSIEQNSIIECGSLGYNISYIIYNDGFCWIYGYGDWYSLGTSHFTHYDKIKDAQIENLKDYEDDCDSGTITSVPNYLFYNCSNMKSVSLPDTVTYLGNESLYNCDGLTSFDISDTVTSTGTYVFDHCSNLANVTIGKSLDTISSNLFNDCTALKSITIPSTVKEIGSSAFSDCIALTNVTIANGVEKIGQSAFNSCSSIISLTIPSSVTYMGYNMLSGCTGLEELTIPYASCEDKSNTDGTGLYGTYTQIGDLFYGDETLYNYEHKRYYVYADYTDSLKEYAIKKITVTGGECVPGYAFYGMSMLTDIVLPDTVTYLGNESFYNCDADVYFANHTSEINSSAFESDYSGTIYGYYESTEHQYAADNNFNFVCLDTPQVLTLKLKNSKLTVGDTTQITASQFNVTYTVSNDDIVSVDEDGNITALGAGSATITATNKYHETAEVKITVNAVTTTTETTTTTTETTITTVSTTAGVTTPTSTTSTDKNAVTTTSDKSSTTTTTVSTTTVSTTTVSTTAGVTTPTSTASSDKNTTTTTTASTTAGATTPISTASSDKNSTTTTTSSTTTGVTTPTSTTSTDKNSTTTTSATTQKITSSSNTTNTTLTTSTSAVTSTTITIETGMVCYIDSITVQESAAKAGSTITLPIRVYNNTGFQAISFGFSFDPSQLTFVDATSGIGLCTTDISTDNNFVWYSIIANDNVTDEEIGYVTFELRQDAILGDVINITGEETGANNTNMFCLDTDGNSVSFSLSDSTLTIVPDETYVLGDIDGNNTIDIADAYAALRYYSQHAAGKNDYTFVSDENEEANREMAADIDKDGQITIADAFLIGFVK